MNILTIESITPIAVILMALVIIKGCAVWLLESVRENQLYKLRNSNNQQKAVNYQLAKCTFTKYSQIYKTCLLLLVLFTSILGFSHDYLGNLIGKGFLADATYVFLCLFALELAMVPFTIYYSFFLEARFGFNTTTIKLYLTDSFKKILLSIIFFLALFSPIYFLFTETGEYWWISASIFYAGFVFFMQLVVPKYVYPLFNKLTPLENNKLSEGLKKLTSKTNFNVNKVYISDGSKRSLHQNAFFAGIGKSRMIVLYDTLVEALNIEELKAVLAHEIGHAKLGHIKKNIFINLAFAPIVFFTLHLVSQSAGLQQVFGLQNTTLASGILIFSFYSGTISFWLRPLANLRSWKYEYEADAYSKKQMASEKPILTALEKLHTENLSLSPSSKLYKIFYQSHPTFEERRKALLIDK